MRVAIFAALLAMTSAASAQSTRAPAPSKGAEAPRPTVPQTNAMPAKAQAASFDALMAMVDKMFPPLPDPDPQRLALARTSVEAMWPQGAYGKMMTGFIGGMFDRVMAMKGSELGALAKPKGTATAADNRTLHDRAAQKDPHFDERMAAIRQIVDEELVKISAVIDPRMREGLARAMARRFDARQLGDINAFFATPSGHALASNYMELWLDPDTLHSMMGSLPELMKLMPELSERMKAVNEKYPKPHPSTPKKAKS